MRRDRLIVMASDRSMFRADSERPKPCPPRHLPDKPLRLQFPEHCGRGLRRDPEFCLERFPRPHRRAQHRTSYPLALTLIPLGTLVIAVQYQCISIDGVHWWSRRAQCARSASYASVCQIAAKARSVADDLGRRRDLGTRDHAGALARRHRQGEGRRQIQRSAAQHSAGRRSRNS